MDEKQLKLLFDDYGSKSGFKDYSEFKSLMSDSASRSVFFKESNKDLGFKDYNEFENLLGFKKKDGPPLPSFPSLDLPSASTAPPKRLTYTDINSSIEKLSKAQEGLRDIESANFSNIPTWNPAGGARISEGGFKSAKKDVEDARVNRDKIFSEYSKEIAKPIDQLIQTQEYTKFFTPSGNIDYEKARNHFNQWTAKYGGGPALVEHWIANLKMKGQGELERKAVKPLFEENLKKIGLEKYADQDKYAKSVYGSYVKKHKDQTDLIVQDRDQRINSILEASKVKVDDYTVNFNKAVGDLNEMIKAGAIDEQSAKAQYDVLKSDYSKNVSTVNRSYQSEAVKINQRVKQKFDRIGKELDALSEDEDLVAKSIPEADKKLIDKAYTDARSRHLQGKEVVNRATDEALGIMNKGSVSSFLGAIASFGDALSTAGYSNKLVEWMQNKRTSADELKPAEYEWSKDFMKRAAASASQSIGASVPTLIPSMGIMAATGGSAVGVVGSALLSYYGENKQNAGQVYRDVLEQTGDVALARDSSREYFEKTIITLPLYFVGALGEKALLLGKGLKKTLVGVALELAEEVPVEYIQGYTEAVTARGYKGTLSQYISENPELLLDIAVGVGGQSIAMKGISTAFSKVAAVAPAPQVQTMADAILTQGKEFATRLVQTQFDQGIISEQKRDELFGNINAMETNLAKLDELGVRGESAKLYTALSQEMAELQARRKSEKDESVQGLLDGRIGELKTQMTGVLTGKTEYIVFGMPGDVNSKVVLASTFNALDQQAKDDAIRSAKSVTVVNNQELNQQLQDQKRTLGNPEGAPAGAYTTDATIQGEVEQQAGPTEGGVQERPGTDGGQQEVGQGAGQQGKAPVEVADTGNRVREGEGLTVSDMLDKRVVINGQPAILYKEPDSTSIVARIVGTNRIVELGNADEISSMPASAFKMTTEQSVVSLSRGGNIVVRGSEYVNNYTDPLAAINTNEDGDIVSVTLDTPDGKKRTFRGQVAEDIAYQIQLKNISQDATASAEFEQFLESEAGPEIAAAETAAASETQAAGTDQKVSREKAERVAPLVAPRVEPVSTTPTVEPAPVTPVAEAPTGAPTSAPTAQPTEQEAALASELGRELRTDYVPIIETAAKSLQDFPLGYEILGKKEFFKRNPGASEDTEGSFVAIDGKGKILFNRDAMERADPGIVIWHEFSHPVINAIRNANKPLYDRMIRGLKQNAKNSADLQGAIDWAQGYRKRLEGKPTALVNAVVDDESINDTVARVAANPEIINQLPLSFRQTFIDFINQIAKLLGIKGRVTNTASADFRRMVKEISSRLKSGESMTDLVGAENVGRIEAPAIQFRANEIFEGVLDKIGISFGSVNEKTGNKKVTNFDVASALSKYYKKAFKTLRVDDFGKKALSIVSDYGTDEVIFSLAKFGKESGKGWYTEDYNAALTKMQELDQDILNNPEIKEIATVVIAISSNSTDVATNLTRIIYAINQYKKTGVIPTDVGTGKAIEAIASGVDRYNRLLQSFGNDVNALKDFLQTIRPVSESKKALIEKLGVSSYAKALDQDLGTNPEWNEDEVLPTSVIIFGPKIGAFYSNLSGLGGTPTIDRWCIRTMYRYRGDMRAKVSSSDLEGFVKENGLEGQAIGNVIALADAHGKLFNAILTGKGEFKGMSKQDRNAALKPYRKGSQISDKLSGVVNDIKDGITEDVKNAAKYSRDFRTFTKQAFEEIQKKVEAKTGEKLDISDIQAILWIYEKNLFGAMGVKQREDSTYSAAANTLVNKVGSGAISLENLKAGKVTSMGPVDVIEDGAMGDKIGVPVESYKDGVDSQPSRAENFAADQSRSASTPQLSIGGREAAASPDDKPQSGLTNRQIYNKELPDSIINVFRASLRKKAPYSTTLQYLDELQQAKKDDSLVFSDQVNDMLDNGVTLNDMGSMLIEDEIFDDARQVRDYFNNIGGLDAIGIPSRVQVSMSSQTQLSIGGRQAIIDKAKADGTYLKAPNGQPTNLSEDQWTTVRTPEFKNWFGDWENDPENASKVVDNNGEPMVVYHGTNATFDEFKKMPSKRGTIVGALDVEATGFFFTDERSYANKAASLKVEDQGGKRNVFEVFINSKNILDLSSYTNKAEQDFKSITGEYPHEYFGMTESLDQWWRIFDDIKDIDKKLSDMGYDSVKLAETTSDDVNADVSSYAVFSPNQIKSATENIGTFSTEDARIQFSAGPRAESRVEFKLVAFVLRKKSEGYTDQEIALAINSALPRMAPQEIARLIRDPRQYMIDSFPGMTPAQHKNLLSRAEVTNIFKPSAPVEVHPFFQNMRVDPDIVSKYYTKAKTQKQVADEFISKLFTKMFKPGRGLPEWEQISRSLSRGGLNWEVAKASKTLRKLDAVAKRLKFEDWDLFRKAIVESGIASGSPQLALPSTAPPSVTMLPLQIQPFVIRMREQIDSLTYKLIELGYVTPEQAIALQGNIGQYVNRAYRLFTEKGWRPSPEEINAAVDFVTNEEYQKLLQNFYNQNASRTRAQSGIVSGTGVAGVANMPYADLMEQASKNAQRRVNDIINKKTNPYFGDAKVESRSIGILKEKKDIPEVIRKVMGEYTDPGVVFMMTIVKQAALAASSQYLKDLRVKGMGTIFFEKNDDNRPSTHSVQMASEGSSVLEPLNGLYTTPEISEALQYTEPTYNEIASKWMKMVGWVRLGKTVLSPRTQIVNFESNLGFAVLNGMVFTKEGFPTWGSMGVKGARNYVADQYRTEAEISAVTEKAIKLDLVGQSIDARSISQAFSSGDFFDVALDVALTSDGVFRKMNKSRKRPIKEAEKLYRMGDDFWKVYAYITERETIAKARYKKTYSELTEAEQEKVDIESSERVKKGWPTFSKIYPFVDFLNKQVPLLGDFTGFAAESIRTVIGNTQMAINDLKDPDMAAAGVRRLAGIAGYIGFRTAIRVVIPTILGYGVTGLIGKLLNDEEEDEKLWTLQQAVPPHMYNHDIVAIPGGKNKHILTVFSLNAVDPIGWTQLSINAMVSGTKDMDPGALTAVVEVASKFMGLGMVTEAVMDVGNNRNSANGDPIYSAGPRKGGGDHPATKMGKSIQYMWSRLEPSGIGLGRRWMKAENAGAEASFMLGFRTYELDLHRSYSIQLSSATDRFSEIGREWVKVNYNPKSTEAEKAEATKIANEKKSKIVQHLNRLYKGYIKIGASRDVLEEMVNDKKAVKPTGMDDKTKIGITEGYFDPSSFFVPND